MHEDNELMEKVKNGDKVAYETLVIKHRAAAVNFAAGIVSDFHTAEDIVQECFAKVYVNRKSYTSTYTFKTYLFTVIRNNCIDYLRENKRFATISFDDFPEASGGTTTEDLFFGNEHTREIYKHLNCLPGDYRTVLYLFAAEGMSYDQIAKLMRKSVPQVKITIYRARKKLKNLCEGVDIFEK